MAKKILVLTGDYVEDYEIMVPFQALQTLGFTIHVACPGKKKGDLIRTAIRDVEGDQTYSEKRGHNFALNVTFDEIDPYCYDALLIPGGRAPEYIRLNNRLLEMVKYFADAKKPIATLGHGMQILTAAKVIQGITCTASPTVAPEIENAGGIYTEIGADKAIVDRNFVTAPSWTAQPEWLAKFIELLGVHIEVKELALA